MKSLTKTTIEEKQVQVENLLKTLHCDVSDSMKRIGGKLYYTVQAVDGRRGVYWTAIVGGTVKYMVGVVSYGKQLTIVNDSDDYSDTLSKLWTISTLAF